MIDTILEFIIGNQPHLIFWLAILMIVVLIFFLIMMIQLSLLKGKYRRLLKGTSMDQLDKIVVENKEAIKVLLSKQKTEIQRLDWFIDKEQRALKKVAFHPYDAFQEQGGKLSYILIILDENDNGIIINHVHSSDFSYSYAKEIKQGKADNRLSKEEKEALSGLTAKEK